MVKKNLLKCSGAQPEGATCGADGYLAVSLLLIFSFLLASVLLSLSPQGTPGIVMTFPAMLATIYDAYYCRANDGRGLGFGTVTMSLKALSFSVDINVWSCVTFKIKWCVTQTSARPGGFVCLEWIGLRGRG